ncbi:STAS domain-containing protein [Ruminococcus sp.]|uniref:STAS domain-containing protein n=1 Tax=Ruminococcus sp. TaxID=41978 RepID=UPI0025D6449E|nr:STAS domain-containing protein [Ruminococcus sp.]MBQ8967442.1 STAS domain-containing protein [Ruminococcus sp.]
MTINKNKNADKLTISIEGRLDTSTAPDLEKEIKTSLEGITELTFDFSALEYISSAGLRVLLTAQKQMTKQGSMTVTGSSDDILEIFEVTGFSDILTIK